MITRILKMFIYALIVFFMIAGIISMKDKFMKFDTNESFEEEENKQDINEDDDEEVVQNTDDENKDQNESTNNEDSSDDIISIDPLLCNPEIIKQIKKNFTTKFNQMKLNMNRDLNNFQRILEYDISNVFVVKENNDETIKEGVDPVIMYNTETFVDDDDEDDDEITEPFTQDIYDGITSPYCLNCKEL